MVDEWEAEDLAKELLTQLVKVNNFFKVIMPNETMIVKFGEKDLKFLDFNGETVNEED
jgi:hypothetical protein